MYEKIKSLTHNKGLEEAELKKIALEIAIKPRTLQLLIDYEDQAFMSQSLATIRRDVPLDFDLEKCKWGEYDREALKKFFERMQFHSLLRRFGAERGAEPKTEAAKEQQIEDNQLSLL
jgi:5'-3' exonuclease